MTGRGRGGWLLWGLVFWYYGRGLFWFRVCGRGLTAKRTDLYPLLFSERVLGRGWQVGRWRVRYLARSGT